MSRRHIANAEARKVIALLRGNPAEGQMMIKMPHGYRVMPEEVWIDTTGRWVRCDGSAISGGLMGYLYPGLVHRFMLRVLFRWWRDQVALSPICDHPRQTEIRWTQDGNVSRCKVCEGLVYHGDDFGTGL